MIPPKGDENNSSSGSNPSIPSDLIMIPPKGDENSNLNLPSPFILGFDNDSPERGRELAKVVFSNDSGGFDNDSPERGRELKRKSYLFRSFQLRFDNDSPERGREPVTG